MNSLLSIVAIGVIVGGITVSHIVHINEQMQHLQNVVNTSKNIKAVQNKIVMANNFYQKPIADSDNVKASELALNATDKDRVLLNRLQAAMEVAVDKENISSPTCQDLAATGDITYNECIAVKNKQIETAQVNNGAIDLPKDQTDVANAINAQSTVVSDGSSDNMVEIKTAQVTSAINTNRVKYIAEAADKIQKTAPYLPSEDVDKMFTNLKKYSVAVPEAVEEQSRQLAFAAVNVVDSSSNRFEKADNVNYKNEVNSNANEINSYSKQFQNSADTDSVSSKTVTGSSAVKAQSVINDDLKNENAF